MMVTSGLPVRRFDAIVVETTGLADPVPVAQTFLDISQGNRVNQNLYDGDLPRLYVRDGVVTQEWTATATHTNAMRRGDLEAGPTGKRVEWRGVDVIPYEDGLVKRKDVYSDSVSILRQVGLL